jgi:hypothetical protein
MSEVSQGHGWWQASDHKWYPPEQNPNYVAPAPQPPELPPPPIPVAAKGPSGGRKAMFVAVGLVAIWVVGMAAIVLFTHGQLHRSLFHDGPSSGPAGSSLSSQSPSYQGGYGSGTSGAAHNFLVETGNGVNGPAVAADSACGVAFTAAQILTPNLNENDWERGCHDALRDHPVK